MDGLVNVELLLFIILIITLKIAGMFRSFNVVSISRLKIPGFGITTQTVTVT